MGRIPEDPVICMSFVNTQLRDRGIDLDEFCDLYETEREPLERRLGEAGFVYDGEQRRFR